MNSTKNSSKKLQVQNEIKPRARPTNEEIDKMVESFLVPVKFHLSLTHTMNKLVIRDWSLGKELKTRDQYCQGWTNEDCKELLRRLEEAEKNYQKKE